MLKLLAKVVYIFCSETGSSLQKFTLLSGSLSVPPDVTLKLSDDISFKAHKVILAAVSPVFNGMLFGNFKEGKSDEVNLDEEDGDIMKLFIDFIYKGNCKLESLDDVLPLMKVVDYYQVNKVPFHLMCGKVILDKLDSSNYLSLLPKFAGVMSEESIKKAADKVMCYSNCDFVSKFDETKDLPEELLFFLLQRDDISNPEIDIFDFLVKWHDYQTQQLDKTLQLVPKLFKCIRYSLINPQLLISKVANCFHVSKQLLTEGLDCLYNKPLDLHHHCKCGECNQQSADQTINRPRLLNDVKWIGSSGTVITFNNPNTCSIRFTSMQNISTYNNNIQVAYSDSLNNGTYCFSISGDQVSLSLTERGIPIYNFPVTGHKIIMFVYDNNVFVKTIKDDEVKTSYSTTASAFRLSFTVLYYSSVSFQITRNV